MASVVKIRRSSIQGKAPSALQLELGELALNTRDGKLFSSTGNSVFEIGANTSVAKIGTLTVGNTSPFTLPTSDGASGQVLKTNGSGSLYWATDLAEVANSDVSEIATKDSSFRDFTFVSTEGQVEFSGNDYFSTTLSYNTENILVYLNGVLLHKTIDYTANTGTTITFDDSLRSNDIVQIQTHLPIENDIQRSTSSFSSGNNQLYYTQTIDNWSISKYRSAKYIVQIEDVVNNNYEVREVLLVHNNSVPYYTETGTISTGGSRVAHIGSRVTSGNVHLLVTPTEGQALDVSLVRISITPKQ